MEQLKKLIVITGASSGIGAATACVFSQHKYPVLMLSRSGSHPQLPNSLSLSCDVTKYSQFEQCIQQAIKKFGPVDCLINNAGIMLHHSDPSKQSLDEWNQMINLNCMGVLNGIKAVLPEMKQKKTGTIINIGSVAGKRTRVAASVYCGTKFFVHAVSENMREELSQDNVRIITIAPGAVNSNMHSNITDEKAREMLLNRFQLFELLNPDKIAHTIFFAYTLPQNCCIRELVIAPTKQP